MTHDGTHCVETLERATPALEAGGPRSGMREYSRLRPRLRRAMLVSRVTGVCRLCIFIGVLFAAGELPSLGSASGLQTECALLSVSPTVRTARGDGRKEQSRLRGAVFSVLRIVLLVYVGLCAYLYVFQARCIYFPTKRLDASPADVGLEHEEVRLTTSDGNMIYGWLVPAERNERGVILLCHGNGGNISHRLETLLLFRDLGFTSFIFDYSGYGASTGRPTEKHTYSDVRAAWDFLVRERNVAPERIVMFGRSLGGAVAAHMASTATPGALVLESTFTSVADMGRQLYPYLPVRLLCRFRYPTREYLARVKCPVIVIHSPDDDMINFRHGRELFRRAPAPKHFIELIGTHNGGFLASGAIYTDGLDDALAEYFPKSASPVKD